MHTSPLDARGRLPLIFSLVVGFCMLLGGLPAQALVINGNSNAFALSADLKINVPILGDQVLLDVGAVTLEDTAPAAYNHQQNPAAINATGNVGISLVSVNTSLTTGLLTEAVSSDVDGGNGSRMADAGSQVQGLDLQVGETALLDPLLSITSNQTISSSASVTGDHGAMTGTLDSILEDLSISVLGTAVDLSAIVNSATAPNTQLIDVGGIVGLRITLNEQSQGGDGITTKNAGVNAIHVVFDAVNLTALGLPSLTDSLLSGDIIIAHSAAELVATPNANTTVDSPAALVLLSSGLLLLMGLRRAIAPKA